MKKTPKPKAKKVKKIKAWALFNKANGSLVRCEDGDGYIMNIKKTKGLRAIERCVYSNNERCYILKKVLITIID